MRVEAGRVVEGDEPDVGVDRVDRDECHGPSLTDRCRWRHSADRLGHHQEVPIDPFSAFEPYGGAVPPELLTGHLLVASPRLADPNFARRVVLVLDHGDHGALGVVLDRPGGVAVGELLPTVAGVATAPAELFTGGPVARNALIGLVRLSSRRRGRRGIAAPPDGMAGAGRR